VYETTCFAGMECGIGLPKYAVTRASPGARGRAPRHGSHPRERRREDRDPGQTVEPGHHEQRAGRRGAGETSCGEIVEARGHPEEDDRRLHAAGPGDDGPRMDEPEDRRERGDGPRDPEEPERAGGGESPHARRRTLEASGIRSGPARSPAPARTTAQSGVVVPSTRSPGLNTRPSPSARCRA
jgi:hypothetical protein